MSQINKHDQKDDIWIMIGDNVFDVTSFQHEHPGGHKGDNISNHRTHMANTDTIHITK